MIQQPQTPSAPHSAEKRSKEWRSGWAAALRAVDQFVSERLDDAERRADQAVADAYGAVMTRAQSWMFNPDRAKTIDQDALTPELLPRDWVASEVGSNTPYIDEPSEMVPPGVYLLGGFTNDDEHGANLVLQVEHALDDDSDDERWTPLLLAQAVVDRLNGGAR